MTPLLAALDRIDAALVTAGFPATSPWWKAELARFLSSGRRRWVIRAGRRAGKSSTLCRLAVAQALAGAWSIPPGDRAVVAVVSLDRGEAAGRLRTMRAILAALRVPYDERGDEIELRDRPVVIRVVTCSTRGTVGFTSVMVLADEMARWESRDTAANPAAEVMASLRPSMATVASAIEVCVSSPWGLDDYHAELFEAGDTNHQIVSFAPTWVANPTITEARTHELEPDERVWSREYAAIPGATLSAAFDAVAVARAFRPLPARAELGAPVGVIDWASGGADSTTWGIVRWVWPEQAPPLITQRVRVWHRDPITGERLAEMRDVPLRINGQALANPAYEGPKPPLFALSWVDRIGGGVWSGVSASAVVERMARLFERAGVRTVFGDQRESFLLRSEFARHRLTFVELPWTAQSKPRAVERVRAWFRDSALVLPDPAEGPAQVALRRELNAFEERLAPSGQLTYGARGQGHDDHVALLVTAAIADQQGYIPSSPSAPRVRRGGIVPIA